MVFGLEEELEIREQQAPSISPGAPSNAALTSGMVPLPPHLSGAGMVPQPLAQPPAAPPPAAAAAAPPAATPAAAAPSPALDLSPFRDEEAAEGAPAHADVDVDAALRTADDGEEWDWEAVGEGVREATRLPRPQRAFIGRVGRAMLEAVQVIGKS